MKINCIFAEMKVREMEKLTRKEEEVMQYFWENEALFVKEILEQYDPPKPHYNTLSTIVRGLEEKGFLSYKAYGNTHQYFAIISKEEYKNATLKNVVAKYFKNSYRSVVSMLIEKEELSVAELKDLIAQIEKGKEC